MATHIRPRWRRPNSSVFIALVVGLFVTVLAVHFLIGLPGHGP